MKISALLLVVLIAPVQGFAPRQGSSFKGVVLTNPITKTTQLGDAKTDEISHELEELGQEIKPHHLKTAHGFNEFHETLVHKLRRAAHEKDIAYHQLLDELEKREQSQTAIENLVYTLRETQKQLQESKAFALAWQATEVNLRNEVELREKERKHNKTMQDLLDRLEHIDKELNESKAYALAWETAEVALYKEQQDHQKEHESVRRLLWQAVKLTGRRIKNVLVGPFKRKK